MQGEGSAMNSLSDTSDIGQGSVSNSNSMSHQPMPRNQYPVESRLSNYVTSSGETTCINSNNHDVQSFNNWSFGEPSSGLNLQNEVNDDRMKMDVCSSPFSNCTGAGPRLEERQFEPINNLFPQRDDIVSSHAQNQVRSGFFSLQGSISNNGPPNDNLNPDAVIDPNSSTSIGLDIEQTSAGALSDRPGTSSDYTEETDGGSSSSFGIWGLSCKRKSLEGTPRQAYLGASPSSFPQRENDAWHAGSSYGPSSLSLSTSARTCPSVGPPQQPNLRRGIASDAFPSSNVTENPDIALRNLGRRENLWSPQEPLPFSILSAGSSRHRLSGPVPFSDLASDLRTPSGESYTMQAPGSSRNIHPFSWDGASTSRVGNISSSSLPGGRISALQEDFIIRSALRNSGDNSAFLPRAEMRNSTQNPTTWNLSSGNTGPSSSTHSLPNPAQISQHSAQAENQQRASEYAPWSLFPSAESESGVQTGHFYPLPSGPPPSQDTAVLSGPIRRGNHQSHSRSSFFAERLSDDALETPWSLQALFLERFSDDALGAPHSLRALAADVEGRRRLISEIRQVLTAMRRAENLRVEDDMIFDQFIYHGMAEIHDRHRDMRLDVDNMSYEELLALEERIGDVSTGLSEGTILKLMKQRKHSSILLESPPDLEPCCVCQVEYADADNIGTLDCGHDFHTNCVKQWLLQKNLCPICKTTALLTEREDTSSSPP